MSKYGMLGLLEGAGKGLASAGATLTENALAAAEDQRTLNRQKLRRQWASEDRDEAREWQAGRDEADREADLADYERGLLDQENQAIANQKRSQENAKYSSDLSVASRAPSEGDKLIARADKALSDGVIDQATYNNITLGLTKAGGDITAKERANIKLKAIEQASTEIVGKNPLQPATPEQMKAINRRALEIYSSATSSDGLLDAEPAPEPMGESAIGKFVSRIEGLSENERGAALAELKTITTDGDFTAIEQRVKQALANKQVQAPQKTPLEKKVEYQITMGDNRPPDVIAQEINKSEGAIEAANAIDRSKPVENIQQLPEKVRRSIERRAQQIFEMEGGKRSVEVIVEAILTERAKG